MSRSLPVSPCLEHLKNEAKALLRAQQKGEPAVCSVLRHLRQFAQAPDADILQADIGLQEVQYALAMEYGFESWAKLKQHVESLTGKPTLRRDNGAVWIDGLPELRWKQGKECTFCGSMEVALAATEQPCSYEDLMGYSGIALRVRMKEDMCPSSAVGELPDEYNAIERTTGWSFPGDVQFGQKNPDRGAITRRVVASIDAGLPVMAYNDYLDMAVIYGYEQAGQVLWWNEYYRRGLPHKMPAEQVGPLQSYIGPKRPGMTAVEQLRASLQLAVLNWRRGTHDGGIPGRMYHYGQAAYDLWIDILQHLDRVDPKELPRMMHGNCIILSWLIDARRAGARFLQDRVEILNGTASEQLRQAAERCGQLANHLDQVRTDQQLFRYPIAEAGPETWTAERRGKEIELLREARQQDTAIIRQLEGVLADMA